MDPDWRIVVELALETSAVELEALLAAGLPGDAAVSRAGRVVYLYARERHVAAVLHEPVRRLEDIEALAWEVRARRPRKP